MCSPKSSARSALSLNGTKPSGRCGKKRGSQHSYFRLVQSPLGSLLAAAYANSWWQDELAVSSYEMNDVQDTEIMLAQT